MRHHIMTLISDFLECTMYVNMYSERLKMLYRKQKTFHYLVYNILKSIFISSVAVCING